MSNLPIYFQILIDSTGYKQYSIGNLNGSYLFTIKNIQYYNTANQQYVVRLKSNILQFDSGSPTNDILFNHRDGCNDLVNPIHFNAQLQTWIDFTVSDYATNAAPAGFVYIVLHCEATKS